MPFSKSLAPFRVRFNHARYLSGTHGAWTYHNWHSQVEIMVDCSDANRCSDMDKGTTWFPITLPDAKQWPGSCRVGATRNVFLDFLRLQIIFNIYNRHTFTHNVTLKVASHLQCTMMSFIALFVVLYPLCVSFYPFPVVQRRKSSVDFVPM